MKKAFIIFLFIFLSAFANYQPIPDDFKKEYKEEITQIINFQIPLAKKEIDNIFNEVENEKNEYIKIHTIEYGIESIIFNFYMKLINKTEKYINTTIDIQASDWYGDLIQSLNLFFREHSIQLDDFYWYLIDITEKYIGKNHIVNELEINGGDDNPWTLHDIIMPYLLDNKINISKIYQLIKYGQKKQKKLEKKYNYQIEIQ